MVYGTLSTMFTYLPSCHSLSLQHDPLLLQASLAADSLLLQQHAALSCCRRVSLQTLSCYNNMLPSLVAGESRYRLSLVTTTCCPLLLQACLAADSLLLQQHAALSCCRRVSLQTLSCYNNMLPSLVAGESRCRLSLVTTTCCPPSYYSLSLQHDPLLLQASLATAVSRCRLARATGRGPRTSRWTKPTRSTTWVTTRRRSTTSRR